MSDTTTPEVNSFFDPEIIQAFVEESLNGLELIQEDLEHLEEQPIETLAAIFRWVHTVKGTAGFFDLMALQSFAHVFESYLQQLKGQNRALRESEQTRVLEGIDLLQDALERMRQQEMKLDDRFDRFLQGLNKEEPSEEKVEPLANRLRNLVEQAESGRARSAAAPPPQEVLDALDTLETYFAKKQSLEVDVVVRSVLLESVLTPEGDDITPGVREVLIGLEELIAAGAGLPPEGIERYEPLVQQMDRLLYPDAPEPVLDWDSLSALARLVPDMVEQFWKQFWVEGLERKCNVRSHDASEFALEMLGIGSARTPAPASAPAPANAAQAPRREMIRIGMDDLNEFTRHAEEVVTELNHLDALEQETRQSLDPRMSLEMRGAVQRVQQRFGGLQESLQQLRASRLSELFDRLPRMLRQLERDLGKRVSLELRGEHLEVDRSVIDLLGDPFVHLIRNSLDHGIETPDVRKQRGKPDVGNLRVAARLEPEMLCLTVSDDGNGIDVQRVLNKALERGLAQPDAEYTDEEVFELLMAPGFSMAEKVTNVSGRGVGMDVVASTIRHHGGDVRIASELGKGSEITLFCPLRLGLQSRKVLVVELAGRTIAVRYDVIREIVDLSLHPEAPENGVFRHRGIACHYLDLQARLGLGQAPGAPQAGVILVLEDSRRQQMAFHADRILKFTQGVIRPFLHPFLAEGGFEGCIVMGTGAPLLVLTGEDLSLLL